MTIDENKTLILVDGSSYLYRAFHALPPLITSKGEPTGAIYGVINMLRRMLGDSKPDYVAMVFDAKGKNFRHEMYPEYKANRPPMDEDLKRQVQPLYDVIEAMGVPLVVVEGVEADDVIGTLARNAAKEGISALISTGDKDMAQLVEPKITLVNTMSNTAMDAEGVKNKFGVRPDQIVDYLTLVGDTSDNVAGVPGVGPKTAVKWLSEYDSLANLIENQEKIKGKVGERFRESVERLPLIKEVVTIKDDLKLDLNPDELVIGDPDTKKLSELFQRLEFRSWLSGLKHTEDLPKDNGKENEVVGGKYKTILTEDELFVWLNKLNRADRFAFDTETTSLDVMDAEIVGISFAVEIGEAIYIPFAHSYDGAPRQLDRNMVLDKLKPLFADPNKIKLGQNLKYDISVLANYDINVNGVGYDTMLESYILNSSGNQHDKNSLALRYLNKNVNSYEDVAGKGAKQIPFSQVDLEKAAPYAALDSNLVLQLHDVMWPEIEKNGAEVKVFKEIEIPLVSVLSRMERLGVCIDEKFLEGYSSKLKARLEELEQQIYKSAETEFNINSPMQLQEILYEKLGLPVLHKTPTGKPSTAESVLHELALSYALPKLILEYRSLSKLKSTYTDALPKQINSKTGRIHTSYNQAVTATGRLSSTNPNLQNIPIRTEEGRKVRQAFVAPAGYKIVSADYSQIELRVMAHLSQDKNLIRAFHNGEDIHRMVAAEIFELSPDKVTDKERRNAKTINFGLIYGMSAFGLAQRIGMSREDAKRYIEMYFKRYPGMKEYIEKTKEFARDNGFVESIFGRRLNTPDIKAKNFIRRSAAERTAVNAPIQGSAADIIKMAMIDIDNWLQKSDLGTSMIMQVHDELVFEVADQHMDVVTSEIKKRMEGVVDFGVPLVVDVGIGSNWDEAH